MKSVKAWQFISREGNRVDLDVEQKHSLHVFVLEHDLIRVVFKKNRSLRLNRTWSIAPDQREVDWAGRDRMSVDGFSLPDFELQQRDGELCITTRSLRVTIKHPLSLIWEYRDQQECWQFLASDRPTDAYQFGVKSNAISHYMQRGVNDLYYGLGERSGDLKRNANRYEMRNVDAMGYSAKTTDPLYKHIPFYITRNADQKQPISYGIFYDNLATCWFDLGNELDNYHGSFRSYRAEDGDLDYYLMLAPNIGDVTKAFTSLCGSPTFGPKWSLGYSGSTMHYTDAANAQERLLQFAELCEQHKIPCDSFQLSSGYTSIGSKRYVFNWNNDKVPNPEKLVSDFHQSGIKLAANIKPCLLQDHPRYAEAAANNLFIKDSEHDQPESSRFWGDDGSHLDFTNSDTVQWWQKNVKEQLLDKGIDSTWNDNNEFPVWDAHGRCNGFGDEIPIGLIRPLQTLLMMRASYEAQQAHAPNTRPFLISRSGCAGMQRYVQTWSGDNRTDWESLRYNIRMGLSLSLSGVSNTGHDVGGFAGPQPSPELFVRWVQNGVMHPRFTIHSWNDDGTVNEPWMFSDATPLVRKAINLRYRLLPYIYNLLWRAHSQNELMLRPTFLDHEHDQKTFEECDDYLFGEELLVASVVEDKQRLRDVYLPDNKIGWYDFYREVWYQGGQTICLPAALDEIPLLVRAGSVIPTSSRLAHVDSSLDTERQLLVYPFTEQGESTTSIFDDDGETQAYLGGAFLKLECRLSCDETTINLELSSSGDWGSPYTELAIILPKGEFRTFMVNGEEFISGEKWLLKLSF